MYDELLNIPNYIEDIYFLGEYQIYFKECIEIISNFTSG